MKVTTETGAVHYETQGAGPALLLLHAFPLSSALWAGQADAFAARHTVVRVDARGFGASDPVAGPLTMEQIADDAAAVLDHLGLSSAVVAGVSMGGYAAFAFARRHAARLRGLVLCDTKAVPDTDEARAGRMKLADKVQAEGASAAAEAMMPKLLGGTTQREQPELVARLRAWILETPPAAIVSALHGLAARPDARPALGTIAVPTLIVRGEEDVVASAEEAREMHAGIRGSRLVTLPRAGHLPNLETPAAFDKVLDELLAGVR